MKPSNISFKDYPEKVRYGIVLVIFSWIFFIISHASYTGHISLMHMTMGMLVCFLVYSLKNWGRIFTVAYDIAMSVMIGVELYLLVQSGSFSSLTPFVIKGGSIFLFILSSAFLLTSEARNFYREFNR
jgi:hypothetical protein